MALAAAALSVGLLAPSASAATAAGSVAAVAGHKADGPLGVDTSGEGLNVSFDIAQTVWTVLVSTALKPLCLNGADSAADDAFVICPVTDEPVDPNWGIGGVPTKG